MITQEELKELLHYNPKTGIFTWKISKTGITRLSVAGTINGRGYRQIKVNGTTYLSHRLAWVYMYGSFPLFDIDHINGDPLDNTASNLRDVQKVDNSRNQKRHKQNTSGCTGVSFCCRRMKWRAYIGENNSTITLGRFNDWFEAVCARKSAEHKLGFHENHGRIV